MYETVTLPERYRIARRVESLVIVEIKAVTRLNPGPIAQLLSYLRLSASPRGLLLNFHEPRLKHGIMRIINDRSPYHVSRQASRGASRYGEGYADFARQYAGPYRVR